MAKTNYITVEVASQRGHTQVKVNGHSEYKDKLDAFRSAHQIDLLSIRVELLQLLQLWDEAIRYYNKDKNDVTKKSTTQLSRTGR